MSFTVWRSWRYQIWTDELTNPNSTSLAGHYFALVTSEKTSRLAHLYVRVTLEIKVVKNESTILHVVIVPPWAAQHYRHKGTVLYNLTPCSFVGVYLRFCGMFCFYLQGRRILTDVYKISRKMCRLHLFRPEYGSNTILRNVGKHLQGYTK